MKTKRILKWITAMAVMSYPFVIHAYVAKDFAVQVEATVSGTQVTIKWPREGSTSDYSISKKSPGAQDWGDPLSGTISDDLTSFYYVDTVASGEVWEYEVVRDNVNPLNPDDYGYSSGYGYVRVGINTPALHFRGKVLLLVDRTIHATDADLRSKLLRLQDDLVADGWMVVRHDVERGLKSYDGDQGAQSYDETAYKSQIQQIRGLIKAEYAADPVNLKTVFLFGHIAVPYSGSDTFTADGHQDHRGAWAADVYYGEMSGSTP